MLRKILRTTFLTLTILILLYCLIGIAVTGPVVVRPGRLELDVEISEERLRDDVELLTSEWVPRNFEHRENLNRTASWIASEFRRAGLRVELQDYEIPQGQFRNVLAVQPGSDPDRGAIIIGAHYDAFGPHPGANDNASGVAVLLELARTLPQTGPKRDRIFVAFSTEEPPFFSTKEMGSYRFAKRLQQQGTKVDLMIALDMVGRFSDAPNSQRLPVRGLEWLYPDTANFLAVVGNLSSGPELERVKRSMRQTRALPIYSFRAPESIGGVTWSDHYSFTRLGLPAVLVTDTGFLRSDTYHTTRDTAEKLDYERMGQVVHALHGVLWERQ